MSIVLSAAIGGAAGAILYTIAHDWGINRRLTALEGQMVSTIKAAAGAKGASAQAERKGQLLAVAAEAAQMIKDGGQVGDVLKTLAAKYPDVAMDLASKFGFKL